VVAAKVLGLCALKFEVEEGPKDRYIPYHTIPSHPVRLLVVDCLLSVAGVPYAWNGKWMQCCCGSNPSGRGVEGGRWTVYKRCVLVRGVEYLM
jgi:hypothetical protein